MLLAEGAAGGKARMRVRTGGVKGTAWLVSAGERGAPGDVRRQAEPRYHKALQPRAGEWVLGKGGGSQRTALNSGLLCGLGAALVHSRGWTQRDVGGQVDWSREGFSQGEETMVACSGGQRWGWREEG